MRMSGACYTITPLLVGVFPSFEISYFLQGTDPGRKIPAPCISWLVRGDNGAVVLVDTGPHPGDASTAFLHNKLEVNPDHRVDRALAKAGVDAAEVQTVVLTHLHFDHCYHLDLLPNARILVERAEMQYAIAPISWDNTGYETGLATHTPPWTQAVGRMQAVDGDLEIAPGLEMVSLPGHTPGSAGLVANTTGGRYLMAGDNVNLVENWEGNARRRHIPASSFTSSLDYFRSFEKMERVADHVLASHDFRMFDAARYPA